MIRCEESRELEMPVELPTDIDAFHALLRRRIRDQDAIDGFRAASRASPQDATSDASPRHVVGQTGCFCLDCLLHRKQEWRVGDVNTAVVGPRDQWRQFTWGDATRMALGAVDSTKAELEPVVTPTVREKIVVRDSKQRCHWIERDAKFTAVALGKHHSLMLSESAGVFACGDNSHGALGITCSVQERATPERVDLGRVKGGVQVIAASAYASFALVVLPPTDAKAKRLTEEPRRPGLMRRKSIEDVMGHLKQTDDVVYNHLVSWGRGSRGVLGQGTSEDSSSPKTIELFNTMKVLAISAGAQHVLVLTELSGVYAFGDGSHGKLGVGDTEDRLSPSRITALDGLNVISISAGGDHSVAVTGETFFNRQVYSWGLGKNGRLGHNDDQSRFKPTRINHFRGRKVIIVVAGGEHNVAISEMPDGICVWSWGSGTYGQLGHRETWDAWLPRSVDEVRREEIRFIDAGERHSVAISESRELWVWGNGVHRKHDVEKPDPSSVCVVQPIKVVLPGIQIVGAKAGYGRTFVWGDRVIDPKKPPRSFGGSVASRVCSALPEFESLISDNLRIIFRCCGCHREEVCIACAHRCHINHCLELAWTLENTLSRDCDCFSSGKCLFDLERGIDSKGDFVED